MSLVSSLHHGRCVWNRAICNSLRYPVWDAFSLSRNGAKHDVTGGLLRALFPAFDAAWKRPLLSPSSSRDYFLPSIGLFSVGDSAKPFRVEDHVTVFDDDDEASSDLFVWLGSTLKKRKAKMNKHKLRKRRKKLRLKSKK